MTNVHLVGGLDIAELTFFAFFLFFLGLVWYLRGEDPVSYTHLRAHET